MQKAEEIYKAEGDVRMARPLLAVKGLGGGYGAGFALQEVSFDIEKGTLTGLLGANGSGKTTLLKMICQQMKHEGTCVLHSGFEDGAKEPGRAESRETVSLSDCFGPPEKIVLERLSLRSLARLVSYIPQRTGITVGMAALDVVLMGFNPRLGLLERPRQGQRRQAQRALETVGLTGYEQRDYLGLSEGQKALVMLARTLVEDSCLLVLDEPDSALDLPNRYKIMSRIAKLVKEEARAGLLSLHDPLLALHFCHHLVLMKEGRLVGRICPAIDPLEKMEAALRQIYGPVTLAECTDRDNRRRLVLLWEQEGGEG